MIKLEKYVTESKSKKTYMDKIHILTLSLLNGFFQDNYFHDGDDYYEVQSELTPDELEEFNKICLDLEDADVRDAKVLFSKYRGNETLKRVCKLVLDHPADLLDKSERKIWTEIYNNIADK